MEVLFQIFRDENVTNFTLFIQVNFFHSGVKNMFITLFNIETVENRFFYLFHDKNIFLVTFSTFEVKIFGTFEVNFTISYKYLLRSK